MHIGRSLYNDQKRLTAAWTTCISICADCLFALLPVLLLFVSYIYISTIMYSNMSHIIWRYYRISQYNPKYNVCSCRWLQCICRATRLAVGIPGAILCVGQRAFPFEIRNQIRGGKRSLIWRTASLLFFKEITKCRRRQATSTLQ